MTWSSASRLWSWLFAGYREFAHPVQCSWSNRLSPLSCVNIYCINTKTNIKRRDWGRGRHTNALTHMHTHTTAHADTHHTFIRTHALAHTHTNTYTCTHTQSHTVTHCHTQLRSACKSEWTQRGLTSVDGPLITEWFVFSGPWPLTPPTEKGRVPLQLAANDPLNTPRLCVCVCVACFLYACETECSVFQPTLRRHVCLLSSATERQPTRAKLTFLFPFFLPLSQLTAVGIREKKKKTRSITGVSHQTEEETKTPTHRHFFFSLRGFPTPRYAPRHLFYIFLNTASEGMLIRSYKSQSATLYFLPALASHSP